MKRNLTLLKILKNSQANKVERSTIFCKNNPLNNDKIQIRTITTNPFGVPLVPPKLHKKLFGDEQVATKIDKYSLKTAQKHLKSHSIPYHKAPEVENVPHIPMIDSLDFGKDIAAHFRDIGEKQIEPFIKGMHTYFI